MIDDAVAARTGQRAGGGGIADVVITPDGRHVFLEINPGGEWFWLDDVFGPRALSAAIADALLAGAARPRRKPCKPDESAGS